MNEELEKWLDADPLEVALKTGDRQLADRVDLLQRASRKIPSYYDCRAVFSRIALEQCTSEQVASQRSLPGGKLAVDLTTGLGVDALYLSRSYERVITVEIDQARARDAVSNFALLGADNIEVVNSSAEEFLAGFDGIADLVFVDPARRDTDGKRIYDISKTSPDVLSLLPVLRNHSRSLYIKCSPMFDVERMHVLFGGEYSVETVSLDGECKETAVIYDGKPGTRRVTVVSSSEGVLYRGTSGFSATVTAEKCPNPQWLVSFDAAIVKSGSIHHFMTENFPDVAYSAAGSYIMSDLPVVMKGVAESRKIVSVETYQPARLKKKLKGGSFAVMRKGFPVSMEILKKQLGFKEGGPQIIAFVQCGSDRYMLSLEASQ